MGRFKNWHEAYAEITSWLEKGDASHFAAVGVVVDTWMDADRFTSMQVKDYFSGILPEPKTNFEKLFQILLAYVAHKHGTSTTADNLSLEGMLHPIPMFTENGPLLINSFTHTPPWLAVRNVILNADTFESV